MHTPYPIMLEESLLLLRGVIAKTLVDNVYDLK